MELRPHRIINRKLTKEIKVGKISVGGKSPISVQSMTNTLTTDVNGTIKQIKNLEEAGADIVRVSCPDEDSTKALKDIVNEEVINSYGSCTGIGIFNAIGGSRHGRHNYCDKFYF